ncbi:hypothetical protein GGTG_01865 [Gaeumannomyces tritici R3-111a-1]|uniref:Uncharacterized protein n=1 Tax=Gaeumannomyces tritici (strain R3-111a-1) TaxID=644352 RepID=J3NKS4_GAET3|nr:hypothetical protein GGTG_01865 [Gaeumannomyces tritici R3-111a-1]EJT81891.1 hypothetical protein GGTG_01865 [Gaeumannomyces tritici R3-111a-1]
MAAASGNSRWRRRRAAEAGKGQGRLAAAAAAAGVAVVRAAASTPWLLEPFVWCGRTSASASSGASLSAGVAQSKGRATQRFGWFVLLLGRGCSTHLEDRSDGQIG